MIRKQNLIQMSEELIKDLVRNNILEIVTYKAPVYKKGRNGVNVYYRVKAMKNLVWLRGKDDYGIFINEFVDTRYKKKVNLIELISKYYWNLDGCTNSFRASKLKNQEIWRCIGSVIYYNDINRKLPTWYHIHHRIYRWCNTQKAIELMFRLNHIDFHKNKSPWKNHRIGHCVDTVEKFNEWLMYINKYI